MVTTIEPMEEGICPVNHMIERGVVVRVEVIRRYRAKLSRVRYGQI